MKKNYIAPATENVMFGSSFLMADPLITVGVTSGTGGGSGPTPSTNIPGDVD